MFLPRGYCRSRIAAAALLCDALSRPGATDSPEPSSKDGGAWP